MKYNVIFKKEFDSKTESVIDTIEAPYAYCLDDYLVDCEHNASDDYNKYLSDLFCKGHLVLELVDFNMLELKSFPDALLKANGITQDMINIINETDLQTAENTKFSSIHDASDYLYEILYEERVLNGFAEMMKGLWNNQDIELVIKIPEAEYYYILKSNDSIFADCASKECMMHSIKNGIPLPKEHGKLITEPTEKEITETIGGKNDFADCIREAVKTVFENAPTIIEADKIKKEVDE